MRNKLILAGAAIGGPVLVLALWKGWWSKA